MVVVEQDASNTTCMVVVEQDASSTTCMVVVEQDSSSTSKHAMGTTLCMVVVQHMHWWYTFNVVQQVLTVEQL